MSEHITYESSKYEKCAVCGYQAYAYLNNQHFCDMHFDLAYKRTKIIGDINARANSKDATPFDKYFRDELFKKQPDAHNQAKWLRINQG
jgi:hypothetical protein